MVISCCVRYVNTEQTLCWFIIIQAALEVYLWGYQGCVSPHCSGCLLKQCKHEYSFLAHLSSFGYDYTHTQVDKNISSSQQYPCQHSPEIVLAWILQDGARASHHSHWDYRHQCLTQTCVTDTVLPAGDWHWSLTTAGEAQWAAFL